jgi:pSer/pThr/pTyr-binding forkhead associated (FHA) protein
VPALIVLSGSEAGRRLEVEGEHTIGREDQEFTLSDPEISRRHAVIRVTATGVEIEDAGSSNGTFVNGDRIAGNTELADGDVLRLGQTTLSVEAPRAQATKISAPPVDPGATVIRPSSERPAPDGPPQEPSPGEPEQPGYRPPGHEEPVPSAPTPGDYQAPQPDQPAASGGTGPDLVTDTGAQGYGRPGYGPPPEQGAYPPPEQSAYPPPEQGSYPPPEQSAYAPPEQGAYTAPPGQSAWQSAPQPAYGAQASYGGGGSKIWLWILIGVVVVAAIAAIVIFFVL